MAMNKLNRREWLGALTGVAAGAFVWRSASAQTKTPIAVYKDPSCGCCHNWVEHMKANGFAPTVTDTSDVNKIKRAHGMPEALWSCHTALIGAYVIEGHVPASDVRRLLAEQPKTVAGLTIPGMPASAPGMDVKPFQPYTVLSFDAKGKTAVFAEHKKA